MLPPCKTRIVATVGPASSSPQVLERMIRAGMNVARLNFSHGEFTTHRQNIENIRAAAKAVGRPVAIMADLSGPKMRIGKFAAGPIQLKAGNRFTLTTDNITGEQQRVSVGFAALPKVVNPGDKLSLNDGYIQIEVTEVRGNDVVCAVVVGGELRSRKGLNLPGIDLGDEERVISPIPGRLADGMHVRGALHERLADRVHAILQRELKALAVALGEGADAEIDDGQVEAFFGA